MQVGKALQDRASFGNLTGDERDVVRQTAVLQVFYALPKAQRCTKESGKCYIRLRMRSILIA